MTEITTTPDKFPDVVQDILNEYRDTITKKINDEVERTAELMRSDIKRNAPRTKENQGKHLADSFVIQLNKDLDSIVATIFSPSKGHITHFLEYGTVKMPPQPFMRRAYDKYINTMIKNIKTIIKEG